MAKKTNGSAKKTVSPKTKGQIPNALFLDCAEALKVRVNDQPLKVEVKEFASKSVGWYFNGKVTITVTDDEGNEYDLKVQAGLTFTVVGSKYEGSEE